MRRAFSESNPQPEFHLPRLQATSARGLIGDYSPSLRAVDVHARVVGLKVIQEIRELKHQRGADPFRGANLLRNGGIQVPGGEAADHAGSAVSGIQSENGAPELRANR